jgi:hypothetical protein
VDSLDFTAEHPFSAFKRLALPNIRYLQTQKLFLAVWLIVIIKFRHLAQAQEKQMKSSTFLSVENLTQGSLIQNLIVLIIVSILRKPGL